MSFWKHEVHFPSANLKMLYHSSSYFKEQDIWKLIYLAELLSILLVTAHGPKRATLPPPNYHSEAKYSDWEERPLGKLGQWRQWTHQILEGPLERSEKYSSFCLQPWSDHANLEGSLGKSGKGRQTDQKGRGRDNEGRVSPQPERELLYCVNCKSMQFILVKWAPNVLPTGFHANTLVFPDTVVINPNW